MMRLYEQENIPVVKQNRFISTRHWWHEHPDPVNLRGLETSVALDFVRRIKAEHNATRLSPDSWADINHAQKRQKRITMIHEAFMRTAGHQV